MLQFKGETEKSASERARTHQTAVLQSWCDLHQQCGVSVTCLSQQSIDEIITTEQLQQARFRIALATQNDVVMREREAKSQIEKRVRTMWNVCVCERCGVGAAAVTRRRFCGLADAHLSCSIRGFCAHRWRTFGSQAFFHSFCLFLMLRFLSADYSRIFLCKLVHNASTIHVCVCARASA